MNYDLYVVTDEQISGGRSHIEIAERAIAGGADVIQLRDKRCGCTELARTGRVLAGIADTSGTLFIVNDRLDVAIACGAHGVHLGQGDMRPDVARQLAPPGFIIGVSVGSVEEAIEAERGGADYVALSPVFGTRSKDDAGPGHGLDELRKIRERVSIPIVAIGGIGIDNLTSVLEAGADGIAVISAVVSEPDITRAASDMKTAIRTIRKKEGREPGQGYGKPSAPKK